MIAGPNNTTPGVPAVDQAKSQFQRSIADGDLDFVSISNLSHTFSLSHLSKWPSDLKINGTQENVTFSGPVFHGLSCGVFLFVASVSFKNTPLNGWNFSTANQVLLFYGF